MEIVAFAPNAWTDRWLNRQQLLSRLGCQHRITYSTGGLFLWQRATTEWKQHPWFGGFDRLNDVWVDVAPRALPRVTRLRWVDRAALRLLGTRLRRWAGGAPGIAYLFHPSYLPYLEGLRPDRVVYHAYDLFQGIEGYQEQLAGLERALLQRADLVIASSGAMAEGMKRIFPREIRVLPNGADFEAFSRRWEEPADLKTIPRPRIGYTGFLHPMVDFGLVAELAAREPNWHFAFVGGERGEADVEVRAEIARCKALSNVHFLGEKPHHLVPAYVANMDVNIMAYRSRPGSWVNAIYPLKLHEYLSAGLPVVSSDLPSVAPFSSVVRLTDGTEAWHAALQNALAGEVGSRESRQAVGRANSWAARVEQLEAWLHTLSTAQARVARTD